MVSSDTDIIRLEEDFIVPEIKETPVDYLKYVPHRQLRAQFHVMNNTDSTANFSHADGVKFIDDIISSANGRLQSNDKMYLPVGNETAVIPAKLSWALSDNSYQFHYDDKLCYFIKKGKNANRYDRSVMRKYMNGEDSTLHIYLMPFDPYEMKSGRQKIESTGIALSTSIKLAGIYEAKNSGWHYGGLLNHEMGHVLGLSHTWNIDDGCPDTPRHANCWSVKKEPPCNQTISNNLMDYNPHQSAITPYQLQRIHQKLAETGRQRRRLLLNDYCSAEAKDTITIKGVEVWDTPRDIQSIIQIEKGAKLYINTRVQMSNKAKIEVKKGGELYLIKGTIFNECLLPIPPSKIMTTEASNNSATLALESPTTLPTPGCPVPSNIVKS